MIFFCSVYITVGGESYYTVLESEYRGCAGLRESSNQQLKPPYDIDWCEFTLVMLAVLFQKIAISHLMECELMLFITNHIPYLGGLSKSFPNSLSEFFSSSDMRKSEA